MIALPSVRRALPDLQAARASVVAVAAAPAAGLTIVDTQLDVAQRTLSLDHGGDRALGLAPQCVSHDEHSLPMLAGRCARIGPRLKARV